MYIYNIYISKKVIVYMYIYIYVIYIYINICKKVIIYICKSLNKLYIKNKSVNGRY